MCSFDPRDHSAAGKHLTTAHEGIIIRMKVVEWQISWCVGMCGTESKADRQIQKSSETINQLGSRATKRSLSLINVI